MSDRSKIEWTDASWNPVRAFRRGHRIGWHCEHVSEGCRNCYAETINRRLGTGLDYKPGHRADLEFVLSKRMDPLHWRRPRRVFVGSMTDLFADFVTDDMLDRIFAVMALCPQHTFQLLTKRPARMRSYVSDETLIRRDRRGGAVIAVARACHPDLDALNLEEFRWPLPNVWLGVSAEDQATADERIPPLLETPASVRFVSYEPALGPVDFTRIDNDEMPGFKINVLNGWAVPSDALMDCGVEPMCGGPRLDWIICGGESGPGARPMHPDWARSVRDQCAEAGVPFFFKQWGEWALAPDDPNDTYEKHRARGGRDSITMHPGLIGMELVGKKRAGRVLDNRTHDAFPDRD